jgi:hypothetical protein
MLVEWEDTLARQTGCEALEFHQVHSDYESEPDLTGRPL